jgi:Fe-S oxidoreductase
MHIDNYTQTISEWKFTPMANYICPTYKVTKNESNAPRGLTLLLSLIEGKQGRSFDEVVVERMYQCNSCYLCTSCAYDETDPASLFNWGLLDKAGVDYGIVGPKQGSGAQFFELGYWDLAKNIAEQTIQEVTSGGYSTLVFLSPYDFKAFTAWYAELGLQIPDVKTIPFPAYLLELIRAGKLTFRKKEACTVTYQDANHFVRPESSFLEIEELLKSVPEVTYKPMWNSGRKADSDAGDFLPFTYPDIARGINEQLLNEVKQTGAGTVLTSCFYALHNLRQVAQPGDLNVSDLGTFLASYL